MLVLVLRTRMEPGALILVFVLKTKTEPFLGYRFCPFLIKELKGLQNPSSFWVPKMAPKSSPKMFPERPGRCLFKGLET